jgi:hypothetical protein
MGEHTYGIAFETAKEFYNKSVTNLISAIMYKTGWIKRVIKTPKKMYHVSCTFIKTCVEFCHGNSMVTLEKCVNSCNYIRITP